jgi:serine/threonine protein kinase
MASTVAHPNVVGIIDVDVASSGFLYLVMELVEGEPLSRRIARGPLPIDEAVRLGRQIAEGLAAAHRRGILHRDLKAGNVIVTFDGEAKILDFGLAKWLSGEVEASLTGSAALVGTFHTMSPEQARGLDLDHRSDLFSFGVLLYEMLTGRNPFTGATPSATVMNVIRLSPPPPSSAVASAPPALDALVARALAKSVESRASGILALSSDLRKIGATLDARERNIDVPARPRGREGPPGTSARGWLVGALVLVLIAAVWLLYF